MSELLQHMEDQANYASTQTRDEATGLGDHLGSQRSVHTEVVHFKCAPVTKTIDRKK